jgi:hypothetical protein
MSFTRFHDDPCRIQKQLQESTGLGRYMVNVPGNGDKPCFMEDPFIRLQKWGANLQTNTINLESDLMGLSRSSNRDCLEVNNYANHAVKSSKVSYPVCLPTTEQPRATHPAWTARDLEQVDWWSLPLNPQENTCIPFHNNLSTRILQKDNFVAQAPCVEEGSGQPLYSDPFAGNGRAPGPLCLATNTCGEVSAQVRRS